MLLEDSEPYFDSESVGTHVIPDNSYSSYILPVAPQICLFSLSENGEINETELAAINARSIQDSTEYYFARDLSKCPGIKI